MAATNRSTHPNNTLLPQQNIEDSNIVGDTGRGNCGTAQNLDNNEASNVVPRASSAPPGQNQVRTNYTIQLPNSSFIYGYAVEDEQPENAIIISPNPYVSIGPNSIIQYQDQSVYHEVRTDNEGA